MTREEAIHILAMIQLPQCGDEEIAEGERYIALDMAIQALSQEPSTDAVSREAVLNLIEKGECLSNGAVMKLPSVTQKSGKCKDCMYWQDNNNGYPHPYCHWNSAETPDADDFCSGFEPQEGEE